MTISFVAHSPTQFEYVGMDVYVVCTESYNLGSTCWESIYIKVVKFSHV